MELVVNRQPVFINETLLEADLEQPVECDVLLPDYCPDIQKILKCTVEPVVANQTALGSRLELEGHCLVTVHYMAQNKRLCRSEYKVPFTKTAELKGEAACPMISVQGVCDYVNCRAVSSRRIDIRGAVTLRTTVHNMREEKAVISAQGMGVQLRRNACGATRVVCQTCKTFPVSEELELPESKGAVDCLLRVGAVAKVLDSKVLAGKVILRGEVALNFLYRTLEGRCETMEYTLPISQMIDAEGADDACRCHVRLTVLSASVEKRCDADGEERLLVAEANVTAHVRVHREYEALCSSDCYSTKYECGCQSKNASTLELTQVVDKSFLYKDRMELPEGVTRVVDLWCRVLDWTVKFADGDALVCGKLCVSLFGETGEDEIEYFEKLVEFEDPVPVGAGGCEGILFHPALRVCSCGYTLGSDNTVEVRAEVGVSGCMYRSRSTAMICEISLDETKEKTVTIQKGLYVCMAEAGEPLWDIAKRYNTSVERIMDENELETDCLSERTMLLVPVL